MSTSSRAKSVSELVDCSSTSISGCRSMNVPMRGVMKRAANDDSIDTTSRRSRSLARTSRVASAITISAVRICCA